MIKTQREYAKGSYRPKRNYYRRDSVELLFRRLHKEYNKTEYSGDLGYLSDGELLLMTNRLLDAMGLITMTDEELNQELSLKY